MNHFLFCSILESTSICVLTAIAAALQKREVMLTQVSLTIFKYDHTIYLCPWNDDLVLGDASLLPPLPWPTWGLPHRGLAVLDQEDISTIVNDLW